MDLLKRQVELMHHGRPMSFKTSDEFLRLFGYSSLEDMPELPKLIEDDPQINIEDLQK